MLGALFQLRAVVAAGAVAVGAGGTAPAPRFEDDVAFLRKHVEVVVLSGDGGAQVAVVPAWQGRVMTSTAAGGRGRSHGWINRELVASGKRLPHMNPYGGEDRFWLGPEGGQFALFFKRGARFDFENWQTPAALDTEPFEHVGGAERGPGQARFSRQVTLRNYAGTSLPIGIERTVRVLGAPAVRESCGQDPAAGLRWVGFQSENHITNRGRAPWTRKGGMPSIWILGMLNPSPSTTVVVPLIGAAKAGAEPGKLVNDSYFGKVPASRLLVRDGVCYFRGDGAQRGKIGVRPDHAREVLGSWDAGAGVLTVVWYNKPREPRPYVSSLWERQKEPFSGDVVNSYNDGPPAPGAKPLGPFYELETSSPGAELGPGATLEHVHRTMHFEGERPALDRMARACLGVSLDQIEGALGSPIGP